MTGFGRVHKQFQQYSITVEIKTVNHRFCEVNLRMPRQLMTLEDKLKKLIFQYIKRGRVEAFISIDGNALTSKELQVDWVLLDQYYQTLKEANQRFKLSESVKLEHLFGQSEFVDVVEKEITNNEIHVYIYEATLEAVKQVAEMRLQEGNELLSDINSNLQYIEDSCYQVSTFAPLVIQQYKERLHKKVSEYTDGLFDETRLLTEVAIFAEKADINEEITRIRSHISQFNRTLQQTEPVGRKLDFLVQELNREINTIGSKANDIGIAEHVVNMKTKLEKIKEQVQNIE
jgi:uncharacterized protein (TIGR00255 family)